MRTLLTIVLLSLLEVASAQRTKHPVATTAILDTMLRKAFSVGYSESRLDRTDGHLALYTSKGLVTSEINAQDTTDDHTELFKLMIDYGILSIISSGGLDCLWCTLFVLEGQPCRAYLFAQNACHEEESCLYYALKKLKTIAPDILLVELDVDIYPECDELLDVR